MRVGKRTKQRQKYVPRHSYHSFTTVDKPEPEKRPRKNAVYFSDWCCKMCYFDWGRGFEGRHLYKHSCAESNFNGALKKYWVDPSVLRYADMTPADEVQNER